MIASKRPGKSVRMNRNFLNAFTNLIGNFVLTFFSLWTTVRGCCSQPDFTVIHENKCSLV
jgi:hypothetical protein